MEFQAATAATPLTSNTYAINLLDSWCIGSVPNGGYVASVLLATVSKHATSTLQHLNQPDTMSVQLQYLRRTAAGNGVVTVRHVKLGRAVSVLHATLSQGGHDEVEGYFTQTNFATQTGPTFPTTFTTTGMSPTPPPVDFLALEQEGEDAQWKLHADIPFRSFRKALENILFYLPKHQSTPSLVEQWVRFRPGGKYLAPFTNESLGFVVDMFPLVVEQFPKDDKEKQQAHWYPTVALNLDIKRRLPAEGIDWLYVRVRAGEISNGRMDLQVVVLDTTGKLVALSSHVALVLSAERNLAARNRESVPGKL